MLPSSSHSAIAGNRSVNPPARPIARDVLREPNLPDAQSLNATQPSKPAAPSTPVQPENSPLGTLIARYREMISRGDLELYGILQDSVVAARRMHAEPSLWSASGFAAPHSNEFQRHLEAVLRCMAPESRCGRQRASKNLQALLTLIQYGIADEKIAEKLHQLGGIERLAREHARLRRGDSTKAERKCFAKIEIPPELADHSFVCRISTASGKCVQTEILGALLPQVTPDDLKSALLSLCGTVIDNALGSVK